MTINYSTFNMTLKYATWSAGIFLLALTSCKTTRYSFQNPPENTISFGDGGGFAGLETGFTLFENGQIFKHNVPGDTIELKSIKKKEAKKHFEKFRQLRLAQLDIEQPGNLYYFIRFTTPDITHSITWGAADYNIRTDILDFYKSMREMVKDRKKSDKQAVADAEEMAKEKEKEKKNKKDDDTGW